MIPAKYEDIRDWAVGCSSAILACGGKCVINVNEGDPGSVRIEADRAGLCLHLTVWGNGNTSLILGDIAAGNIIMDRNALRLGSPEFAQEVGLAVGRLLQCDNQ